MELYDAIYTRRSIRAYDPEKPVARETLDKIISAAQMAPSWKNTQTADFIAVVTPEMRRKVLEALPAFNANSAAGAPVILILTARKFRAGYERDGSYSTKKEDRWEMFDSGLAAQNLCLAAWNEGLGTCIMGIYDEDRLPALLELPEDRYVTAVIPMGYPAQSPNAPKRKDLEEKVRYV